MGEPTVEVLGVHPVPEVQDCFLVEMVVAESASMPDFSDFTQPVAHLPRAEWQVPYDEKLLDQDGTKVVADPWERPAPSCPAKTRMAFFFHDLDPSAPLQTPFGEARLPSPTPMPPRLAMLRYEAP